MKVKTFNAESDGANVVLETEIGKDVLIRLARDDHVDRLPQTVTHKVEHRTAVRARVDPAGKIRIARAVRVVQIQRGVDSLFGETRRL